MNKSLKKGLLITAGIFGFIILALAVAPFLFKDQIKAKIDSTLAKSVNAKIEYNIDKFSLSLIRNFPNATISIGDFIMTGKVQEFKGDTLFSASEMRFTADIMSVIKGDKIKIKGVLLDKPYIYTAFAKNGKLSWDIAVPSTDTAKAEPGDTSKFDIQVEKWEIKDGRIIYDDRTMPMYADVQHLDHTGSGDFTQDIVDVATKTHSPNVFVSYDNVTYLNGNDVASDLNLNMDMPKSKYTFKENTFSVNDFKMGLDGWLAMPTDDMDMDLTFKTKETTFKSLLSLMPAIYKKDFDKIQTEGTIAFDGNIKGIYNDTKMPGYNVNLKVNNAMFKYPDLPTAITEILVDLNVSNKDGVTNNTILDLKKLHLKMGANPVDARVYMAGISPGNVDAEIKAALNLAEVEKMYPMEGLAMKGLYTIDAKAKGIYDSTKKSMPVVNAVMSLANGYVKSSDFPAPIENLSMHATANSDGSMQNSSILIDHLKLSLDNEPFEARISASNFDNIAYDATIKGLIDLTKMTKIYPLEGMKLEGKINANIETKGVMSDVEAGKYDKTSTSGTMNIKDMKYWSTDLPQGMTISDANFSFTPAKMDIQNMTGTLGKSDMKVDGYIANYMGYMFSNGTVQGKMNFISEKFDVNEWMVEDAPATPQTTAAPADTAPFEVPKNIDFVLASKIQTVLYTNMKMENLTGNIIMKDGVCSMDKINFNMLGGSIATSGTYDTRDIKKPTFSMNLDMKNLSIPESYKTFSTFKKFAPAAENMTGAFSASIKDMKGGLGNDMMPLYNTLSGNGNLQLIDAQYKDSKVFSTISSMTKLSDLNPLAMKDVNVKFKIADGKVSVEPFDVKAGNTKMNISGNQSIDGALDYLIKMDIPAGAIGANVNGALSKLTGGTPSGNENVKMDFKVGGTYNDPKIGLAGSNMKDQAKDMVKDAVKDKVTNEVNNNQDVQKAKEDADKAKKDAEEKARLEQERIKKQADDRIQAQKDSLAKAAKDKLKIKKPW
ncbi:MAG: AsmA-like C-terminal region-containing protein [Cytophagaceae bacterium]